MSGPYATSGELTAFIGTDYTLPAAGEITRLLDRASEVIDDWTLGKAEYFFADPDGIYASGAYAHGSPGVGSPIPAGGGALIDPVRTVARDTILTALSNATCAQIEFWLEVGEAYDVAGLGQGASVQAGRVQVNKLPMAISRRSRRFLRSAGFSREAMTS